MPVIGRLDGQVDDVLIAPISKRRRDEEQPSRQVEEPNAQREKIEHSDPPVTNQTPTEDESSAQADELPAWLL
jgi:hypothetical protein